MDDAKIEKGIALGADISVLRSRIPNSLLIDLAHRYPDRIIAFACVEPILNGMFDRNAPKTFQKLVVDEGLSGLGELFPSHNRYSPADERIFPLYEKVQELGVPVVLHQCASPTSDAPLRFSSPLLVDEVAMAFPDMKIVITGLGYPWSEETFVIMRKHPNVYSDMGALCSRPINLAWNLARAREYCVLNKILFGSDFPGVCRPMKNYVNLIEVEINTVSKRCGLPSLTEEEIDGLLGDNATRMLGL